MGEGSSAADTEARAAALQMRNHTCVDCADRAVWSVSTAKHGCGVQNLLDWHVSSTFWQSDGLVPHSVILQFRELMPIAYVEVLTNADDESYAPLLVELRGGVQEGCADVLIASRELPKGWCRMYTWSKTGWGEPEAEEDEDPRDRFFWCTVLELRVLENHSRGRDCRIRGMRVHAAYL